ncbi:MAG: 3-phosphoshikimate 1-carboxyvinyltransferase, partial [Alphaproteobacteria bacterium]
MTPQTSSTAAPLAGTIAVPGDKSISHRALLIGALAIGVTRIDGLLEGEDVLATAAALRLLGVTVEKTGDGVWTVNGRGIAGLCEPSGVLDMGNSGTAARLLMGVLAGHPFPATLSGDASLNARPMGRVTEPLAAMGVTFSARSGDRLPLTMTGRVDPLPLEYRLPVASAQVKSAILLAGLSAPGVTRVVEPTPTRDHTERMLSAFGAEVSVEADAMGRAISVTGQPELIATDVSVPGDISSAAFPLVAALLVPGSDITIENIGVNPERIGLLDTLIEMGADIRLENQRQLAGEPVADIRVVHGPLKGITVPAGRAASMIDEYPILAVAAAFADGLTTMKGLAE